MQESRPPTRRSTGARWWSWSGQGARPGSWLANGDSVVCRRQTVRVLGVARSAALRFVCSDMWKPYLKVVVERAGQAVHVLDRFHIMSHFSKAIDEVRAVEARKLAAEACPRMGVSGGKAPMLERSRWLLFKRPENLSDAQHDRPAESQSFPRSGMPGFRDDSFCQESFSAHLQPAKQGSCRLVIGSLGDELAPYRKLKHELPQPRDAVRRLRDRFAKWSPAEAHDRAEAVRSAEMRPDDPIHPQLDLLHLRRGRLDGHVLDPGLLQRLEPGDDVADAAEQVASLQVLPGAVGAHDGLHGLALDWARLRARIHSHPRRMKSSRTGSEFPSNARM